MPISWRSLIQQPSLVQHLFQLMTTNFNSFSSQLIKRKSALSLQHLAYVRHAIFETADTRQAYLTNFITEMIKVFQSQAFNQFIMSDRELYKEFVPIIAKLQINF